MITSTWQMAVQRAFSNSKIYNCELSIDGKTWIKHQLQRIIFNISKIMSNILIIVKILNTIKIYVCLHGRVVMTQQKLNESKMTSFCHQRIRQMSNILYFFIPHDLTKNFQKFKDIEIMLTQGNTVFQLLIIMRFFAFYV